MQFGLVGRDFMLSSGFLDTANDNSVAVLFPQTASTTFGSDSGCFNWYGYLGDLDDLDYAKKSAVQMEGIFKMIEAVVTR